MTLDASLKVTGAVTKGDADRRGVRKVDESVHKVDSPVVVPFPQKRYGTIVIDPLSANSLRSPLSCGKRLLFDLQAATNKHQQYQ